MSKSGEKPYIYIGRYGEKIKIVSDSFYNNAYVKSSNYSYNTYTEVINCLNNQPADTEVLHRPGPYCKRKDLIQGKPIPCKHPLNEAIGLVYKRQIEEKFNKKEQLKKQMANFKWAIMDFNRAHGNPEIVTVLKKLRKELMFEILTDRCYKQYDYFTHSLGMKDEEPTLDGPDMSKTHYPVILKHFTKLTKQLAKHPHVITLDEIEKSSKDLEAKLSGNSLSNKIKSVILGVFTTLTGVVLGAIAGGLITGGPGAIPGALIGGAAGLCGGSALSFFKRRNDKKLAEIRDKPITIYDNRSKEENPLFDLTTHNKRQANPKKHAEDALGKIKEILIENVIVNHKTI